MPLDTRFDLHVLSAQWLSEVERVEQACFSAPWSRAGLESDILGPCSYWYGAVDQKNGRLAAFLGAHVIADEAEIVNVATAPAYRRLGLAAALIEHLLHAHPGLAQIFLEVRASNTAAQALYEKMGFSRYAVRRDYYENPMEDAILMRCQATGRKSC